MMPSLKNNIIGSLNVGRICIEHNVKHLVLISTDKAVNPTNIMGASKRVAEISMQAIYAQQMGQANTNISIVRFGNVLDSSGSVIPKFRAQIKNGGPITLTHPDVTRYFMTIPEAAQLVIQAAGLANGGEVFVLEMGSPVKIYDLARRMINLSGRSVKDELNPDGEIEIKIVGLSPGEKLHEELFLSKANRPTRHPKISYAIEPCEIWQKASHRIQLLESHLNDYNEAATYHLIKDLVE
jgi:FlaA1/EpsC-like NDP-sugar epimerase